MSLSLHSSTPLSTNRISYTKANEFIKLLDECRPAHELSNVLAPGTYHIGSGNGVIQWNGQIAYHAPPDSEVEVFDYLKKSPNMRTSMNNEFANLSGNLGRGGLAHEIAAVHNGGIGGLHSSLQRGGGKSFVEAESVWSRGWAEAERQEQLRR